MVEELKEIGKVIHFFGRINVAIIKLKDTISIGDKIAIIGPNTNIKQPVESIEIEHSKVTQAIAGQSIGIKVKNKVREKDTVYEIN